MVAGMGALFLFLVAGCGSDQGIHVVGTGAEPVARILVEPTTLDFGQLPAGGSASAVVTVSNVGTAPLDLGGAAVQEGSDAFAAAGNALDALAPDTSVELTVTFTPTGALHQGRMVVLSDDPTAPESWVDLTGAGTAPVLEIRPDPADFGGVSPGCWNERTVELRSVGTAALVIDAVAATGEGFALVDGAPVQVTLEPGQALEVPVAYAPAELAAHVGQLWVESNEAVGSRASGLMGKGTPDPFLVEDFWQEQVAERPVDILFWADRSCSMRDNTAAAVDGFPTFLQVLSQAVQDWQVTVASRATGCHSGATITPATANPKQAFKDAVWEVVGGTNSERGLQGVAETMNPALGEAGQCNDGMLRQDASLHVVFVSDEPDQSEDPWDSYVATYQSIVPDTVLHGVVGDVPDGCSSSHGSADPGWGYYEAVLSTGGQLLSVCDEDWGEKLSVLAEVIGALESVFPLSAEPLADSIAVLVDGVEWTSGWTYDATRNAVVFDPLPPSGAHIQVHFRPASPCLGPP